MPRAIAMGARVEQSSEFVPCAGRAGRCQLEGVADSLHRLPSAAEDLQVIIPCRNRALLLQGEFWISLCIYAKSVDETMKLNDELRELNWKFNELIGNSLPELY